MILYRLAGLLVGLAVIGGCHKADDVDPVKSRANELSQKFILVDTHVDVPYRLHSQWEDISQATEEGDFDYPRAVAGGVNAPFMSIYVPASYEIGGGAYNYANYLIDMVEGIIASAPDKFASANSVAAVEKNFSMGKISLPMGIENGAPIEGKLANLQHFYERGVRYITLAHSQSNHISDSSYDKKRPSQGLSDFGKEVVLEMNRLGIMVDVSHMSDQAFYQVLEITKSPVIASHSSARYFTPGFERNMDDVMIEALAQNGGVIQVSFGSIFLSSESLASDEKFEAAKSAYIKEKNLTEDSEEVKDFSETYRINEPYIFSNVEMVLDHFDHIRSLVGIDHVGIGSDFEGVGDSLPTGLKDVSELPNLVAGFLRRGYSEKAIEKILGGNILRVWAEVERIAEQQAKF